MIQFNARIDSNGQTKGEMTFVGAAEIPDQDVDGTGNAAPASHPSTNISCASFPLGAYALDDVAQGAGNIQVKP